MATERRVASGAPLRLPSLGARSVVGAGAAGVLLLALTVFIADGHQGSFAVALGATAVCAVALSLVRSWAAVVLVFALATVGGPELRGELGHGQAITGSLRLLDVGLAAVLCVVVAKQLLKATRWRPSALKIPDPGSLFAWSLLAIVFALATTMWAIEGAHDTEFVRTDVRLVVLALGVYVIARAVPPADRRKLVFGITALAVPLAIKAFAIQASDIWVIGANDRLQASIDWSSGRERILLVGGDTLAVLGLAASCWLALSTDHRWGRLGLLGCGAAAGSVVLLSGTRTSVIVAALGLVVVGALHGFSERRLPRGRVVAIVLASLLVVFGGALAAGIVERFQQRDAPHVGLNFRTDEVRTISHLPDEDLFLGRGFGGTFVSKDVNGTEVTSGWSHVLPAWIVLKVGMVGLALICVLLTIYVRRAMGALAHLTARTHAGWALIAVLGLVLMSMTLGRAAQPEGAMFLGLACALLPHTRLGELR